MAHIDPDDFYQQQAMQVNAAECRLNFQVWPNTMCANDLTPTPDMPFAESVQPDELVITPADDQLVRIAVDKHTHELRYLDESEHEVTVVITPRQ